MTLPVPATKITFASGNFYRTVGGAGGGVFLFFADGIAANRRKIFVPWVVRILLLVVGKFGLDRLPVGLRLDQRIRKTPFGRNRKRLKDGKANNKEDQQGFLHASVMLQQSEGQVKGEYRGVVFRFLTDNQ